MSLILKGIDLPEKNQSIFMEIFPNGRCSIMKTEKGECYELKTRSEAKAIQIPKGHGRLTDKDELLSYLKKDPLFSLVEQYGISGVIESRPTILEVEE